MIKLFDHHRKLIISELHNVHEDKPFKIKKQTRSWGTIFPCGRLLDDIDRN